MGQTSERLRIAEVSWEEKPAGNGRLLRQVFDLILRRPEDLTDSPTPLTMPLEPVGEKEGGER